MADDGSDNGERAREWKEFRANKDMEYTAAYNVEVGKIGSCMHLSLQDMLGNIRPLCAIVVEFAIPRLPYWLAREHLRRILNRVDIDSLLDGEELENKEDELISIEKQIADYDPAIMPNFADLLEGESQPRFLFKYTSHVRLLPVHNSCDSCEKKAWTAVCAVQSTSFQLKLNRKGVNWTDPNLGYPGRSALFVCDTCRSLCMCTPIKATRCGRSCSICFKIRCLKHHFNQTQVLGDRYETLRCDDCLIQLELGSAFSDILKHPNPHLALDLFLQTRPSTS